MHVRPRFSRSEIKRALRPALASAYADGLVDLVAAREPEGASERILPTGLLALDGALRIGGWPAGCQVEIFGPPASGKTSLVLASIAEAQRRGLTVALVEPEATLTDQVLSQAGVDRDRLILVQPETGEDAVGIIERLVASRSIGLVAIDSCAALLPREERDKAIGEASGHAHARMMSAAVARLRRLQGSTVVLLVNQIRNGLFEAGEGLAMQVTTGGALLRGTADIRVETAAVAQATREDGSVRGIDVRLNVVKNRFGPPFGAAAATIVFGRGFSPIRETVRLALDTGILKMTSRGLVYRGRQIGADVVAGAHAIKEDVSLREAIRRDVRLRLAEPDVAAPAEIDEE